MADITIDAATTITMNTQVDHICPVWTSISVGYVFYVDATPNLVYRKTTDGGNTWGAAVTISAVTVPALKVAVWFDKWTTGDTGTKIHIVWLDYNYPGSLKATMYRNLDTATDTFGAAAVAIYTSSYIDSSDDIRTRSLSITKSRGGNLYVKSDNSSSAVGKKFYRSTDGGVNWTSRTNQTTTSYVDWCQLFPANLADNQDIWGIQICDDGFYDLKIITYDDSSDTWASANVNTDIRFSNSEIMGFSGAVRHSDGHLILAVWSKYDDAFADLLCYDITDAGTITAKTNVLDDTGESVGAAVGVDSSDNIYVGYLKGGTWGSSVAATYKKSTNGGTTWGTAVTQQGNSAADMRGIWMDKRVVSTSMIWWNNATADLMCPTVVLPSATATKDYFCPGLRDNVCGGFN